MTRKEQRAKELAIKWHGDQRYGTKPYSVHLQDVRDVLVEMGVEPSEDLLCAAWLHDALEDTDMPVRALYAEMGDDVMSLVWAVTGFGKNRKERAECVYAKIEGNPRAVILKCADRIANMRMSKGSDLEQMYMKAWREFHDRVAVFAPRELLAELVSLHEEE